MIESFHSKLKTEEFQYIKFNSLSNINVVQKVDEYLRHYYEECIQKNHATSPPKNLWFLQPKIGVLCVFHITRSVQSLSLSFYKLKLKRSLNSRFFQVASSAPFCMIHGHISFIHKHFQIFTWLHKSHANTSGNM